MNFFCKPIELEYFKICDPNGIDCARKQNADKNQCQIPCEGMYADFWKEEVEIIDEATPGMEETMKAYEKYKYQFSNKTVNPPGKMSSSFLCKLNSFSC